MTIRHTPLVSELRLFEADAPPQQATYDACCNVVWESDRVIWLRMLRGRLTLKLLRELVDWLDAQGIVTIRAQRAPRRLLPLATRREDGSYEVRVADAKAHGDQRRRGAAS